MSNLSKRHASEKRFRIYGIAAIGAAVLAMVVLIGTITVRAIPAFVTTEISMDVFFDPEIIDPEKTGKREEWLQADYNAMVLQSLRKIFPRVRNRRDRRNLLRIMSSGGGDRLRNMVVSQPAIIGKTMTVAMPASDDIDMLMKGKISRDVPEDARRLSNKQLKWLDALQAKGHVHTTFNTQFFTSGDSREPELAGIWASVVGSVLTLTITLLLSFPLGVSAAIYLEEFAPKNRWTDLIEVNINNLAAVPSIVFGLLGLAVFLSFFGLPRSAYTCNYLLVLLSSISVLFAHIRIF